MTLSGLTAPLSLFRPAPSTVYFGAPDFISVLFKDIFPSPSLSYPFTHFPLPSLVLSFFLFTFPPILSPPRFPFPHLLLHLLPSLPLSPLLPPRPPPSSSSPILPSQSHFSLSLMRLEFSEVNPAYPILFQLRS